MKLFQAIAILAFFQGVCSIPISEVQEKASQGLRLLQLGDDLEPVWKTEEEKFDLLEQNVGFFDVTETYELEQSLGPIIKSKLVTAAAFPSPSHQSDVTPLLASLDTTQQATWLAALTAFNNRYYTQTSGADAAKFIQTTLGDFITASGRTDVSVSPFAHTWVQSSTILKFAASVDPDAPVTILGAHMDSIQGRSATARAPGADDDGTGSVNLIDVARVLIQSGFVPSTPLEFHWYAAEEVGLLGSQDIAVKYKADGVEVKGMLQCDMTGYTRPGAAEVMGLVRDFTDPAVSDFVSQLAETYSRIRTVNTTCGYACSDHGSWTRQGYPSAFNFETAFGSHNPAIHTANDTVDAPGFSWEHSVEFAKVVLGFAYELTV